MMGALLKLESFDDGRMLSDESPLDTQAAEALRASAFEQGYGAGWTDALDQMRNEDALRRTAAEEALQTISFGFHEARAALETCFIDLCTQMVAKVLPTLVPQGLSELARQELCTLAASGFDGRLELLCCENSIDALQELASGISGIDIKLIVEPSFSDAQILLRVNQNERMIDLDGVLSALMVGCDGAVTQTSNLKDSANG